MVSRTASRRVPEHGRGYHAVMPSRFRDRIVQHLAHPGYRASPARTIAREMRVPDDAMAEFESASAGHGGMTFEEMDNAMMESILAFPAETEGKGNPVLAPTEIRADGTKVFDLTAEIVDWELEPGKFADLVVLDPESPVLGGLEGDAALDALVTAGSAADIQAVHVGGRELVRAGRHAAEDEIQSAYITVMDRLRKGL